MLARWRPLVVFSLIEMAVPWLLLSDAEQHLTSSLTGLLVAAVPLVGVVVAKVAAVRRAGRPACSSPACWSACSASCRWSASTSATCTPRALVEILVVVVGYAVAPVIMARRLADLPSIPVVCASLLVVAIGYLPYAAFHLPSGLTGQQLGCGRDARR